MIISFLASFKYSHNNNIVVYIDQVQIQKHANFRNWKRQQPNFRRQNDDNVISTTTRKGKQNLLKRETQQL